MENLTYGVTDSTQIDILLLFVDKIFLDKVQ